MKIINDINILINENTCPKVIRRLDKWGRIILPQEFRNKLKSNYLKVQIDSGILILIKDVKEGIKINENGRIMIPKKIRKDLKWIEKDLIDIYLYKTDCIIMKKTEIQHIRYV